MYTHKPRTDAIRVASATYAANAPLIRIYSSREHRPGEVMTAQKAGHTIAVAPTGGSGGKVRFTITERVFDATGTAATPVTTTIDGATVETLGGLIDALNAIDGITAWALDAPHSFSVDSDDFEALSATAIPEQPGYLDCVQREVATANLVYKRVGVPEVRDAGALAWTNLEVSITNETAGYVEIGTDDKVKGYQALRRYSLTDAAVDRFGNYKIDDAPTVKGPVLITVGATNLTGTVVRFEYMSRTI